MAIVVKVGGSILGEGVNPSIVSDIQNLAKSNKLVIVHGGGDEVTEIAEKMVHRFPRRHSKQVHR